MVTKKRLFFRLPSSFTQDVRLFFDVLQKRRDVFWGIIVGSFAINLLSVAFPIVLLQVYDRVIPNEAIETLVLLLIGVGVVLILEMVLKILRFYISSWSDAKYKFFKGRELFQHLLNSDLRAFEKKGAGVHVKRLDSVNMIQNFYTGQAVISIVDVPFLFLFLFLIGYIGGWLVIVAIAILIGFISRLIPYLKKIQDVSKANHKHEDSRINFIIETLNNIHTIKSMAMEAQMLRRYERLQKLASEYDYYLSGSNADFNTLSKTMSQVMILGVVGFGSILVIKNMMTVGGLAACMLLSTRCVQPISSLITVWSRIKLVAIVRENMKDLLDLPQESKRNLPVFPKVDGAIRFKNVSFKFQDDSPWVLKNINLNIKKNDCIAVVGERKTGKSSLLWLLNGILTPSSGDIYIDEKNISEYEHESLRTQIGYLPRKPVIFNGTIMENLTMFEEEKYSNRVREIADMIGLDEIIRQLPQGYSTTVASRSVEMLPQGVNQRIAIARALLREPPIILFDEANSSIDLQGDEVIKRLLKRIIGRCTLVIVSHRPSVLSLAKKHYALKNANLVEIHEKA